MLLAELVSLMRGHGATAVTASADVDTLISDSLKLGVVRKDLTALLSDSALQSYAKPARRMLEATRHEWATGLPRMKRLAEDQGPPIAQHDWAKHLGQMVRVVGRVWWDGSRPKFANALLNVRHNRRLWLSNGPRSTSESVSRYIVVTGRLEVKNDIPVYRYKKGKPFARGLPVPLPYMLKDMSRRFYLKTTTWTLIGTP